MSREEVLDILNEIGQDVFDNYDIELTDATTAEDIEEWDSLTHLGFINEIELRFSVKFTLAEVRNLKNVGELVDTIIKHM